MKQKVYIETSVVSYLSGRLSRDVVIVGRQQITREIWPLLTERFDCYVSALAREEIERGEPEAGWMDGERSKQMRWVQQLESGWGREISVPSPEFPAE